MDDLRVCVKLEDLFSSSLHKEKNDFLTNIMVQVLLKQGQVEVSTTDLTADYSDSVLLHRSLVEDLNRNIRVRLCHQKNTQTLLMQNIDSLKKRCIFS